MWRIVCSGSWSFEVAFRIPTVLSAKIVDTFLNCAKEYEIELFLYRISPCLLKTQQSTEKTNWKRLFDVLSFGEGIKNYTHIFSLRAQYKLLICKYLFPTFSFLTNYLGFKRTSIFICAVCLSFSNLQCYFPSKMFLISSRILYLFIPLKEELCKWEIIVPSRLAFINVYLYLPNWSKLNCMTIDKKSDRNTE